MKLFFLSNVNSHCIIIDVRTENKKNIYSENILKQNNEEILIMFCLNLKAYSLFCILIEIVSLIMSILVIYTLHRRIIQFFCIYKYLISKLKVPTRTMHVTENV